MRKNDVAMGRLVVKAIAAARAGSSPLIWMDGLVVADFTLYTYFMQREASMKEFSFSDLNRRSGDVLDAALAEPVKLMKRGKAKIVMLPQEQYERMRDAARPNEQAAFTLDTAPEEDIENLMAGFQEIIDQADREGR